MPTKRAPWQRTVANGTDTTEGFIPHKVHRCGFEMPVAIVIDQHPLSTPKPVRRGNTYEWVLPGGGRYVE